MLLSHNVRHMRGLLEYSTNLFNVETIARLASQYSTLVEVLIDDPDQPVCRLGGLPMLEC